MSAFRAACDHLANLVSSMCSLIAILFSTMSREFWNAQDCLKLVAALLRGCREWDPPVGELRALVGGAYADITTASAALLGVLRAVLTRKLVEVVEVYDVMKRIQVGSARKPVRHRMLSSGLRVCSGCIMI